MSDQLTGAPPLGTGYGPQAPVPIYQWEAEFEQLLRLYVKRKPKRVLEIGTYHGGTLYHWLQNAQPGTAVVSVDNYVAGVDNRALYSAWCPPRVLCHTVAADSNDEETAKVVRLMGPYDWIWIDADHLYESVRRDWELYSPMCNPGGVVCFHDILPPSVAFPTYGVNVLWDELKARYRTEEFIADPKALWGGIGVVFP